MSFTGEDSIAKWQNKRAFNFGMGSISKLIRSREWRHEMDFRVISRRTSLLALLSLSVMRVPRITAKACREYTLASAVKTKEL